jgi:hypothetical protein
MTKAIDRATAHFKEMLASDLRGPIKVPEWDLDVYWHPSTTMAEESVIIELSQSGKQTEALVMSLIIKAKDAEGKKIFETADKVRLMRAVDPAVILRIVTSMNDEAEKEADDALGN